MKLIIDELEAELDDLKSGNKNLTSINNNNSNNNNNSGINTNRLKQLSVSLNNTSLINHLKKENERLRKLVITNELKNKRFFEEYQTKNSLKSKENTNLNSMDRFKVNNENFINNSNQKEKSIYNIINSKNNSNKKNTKEMKGKTFKKEKKVNKIIKEIKNSNLINSSQSKDNNINNFQRNNMSTNNYAKIINHNKNKKNNSLIERYNNSSINTNLNNYNNLVNKKLKSKNIFVSNVANKSMINHKNKKYNKDFSSESRNYSRGLNKNFNNSFNESFIDKKYLSNMTNIERNIPKTNYDLNKSMIVRAIGNGRIKKKVQDNSLNISNDYISMTKRSVKEKKKIKRKLNDTGLGMDLSEQKISSNKNYYNTVNNDLTKFKNRINNLNNNHMKKKESNKNC